VIILHYFEHDCLSNVLNVLGKFIEFVF